MIKHAHHKFDVDKPGKDSYELRKSGADQMLICSSRRFALMTDFEEEKEPVLSEYIERLDMGACDLILVEGFKHEEFPKIELHRPSVGKPLICAEDENIIAVGTDEPDAIKVNVDLLPLNEPEAIAAYVMHWLSQQTRESQP
jgi:molybdopterin-guanine dinucleotide biosynthesis protein B